MLSKKEKHDLALTIAGEIHPGLSPYGTQENRFEIANILATIENRFRINRPAAFGKTHQLATNAYRSRSDVVKQPQQYSTWNDEIGRSRAKQNYSLFSSEIERAIGDFYRGRLEAGSPYATHYWAPAGMLRESGKSEPSWASAIDHQVRIGPHIFGTAKGLLDDAMVAAIEHNGGAVPTKRGYAASDRLRDATRAAYGPLAGDMTLLETPALPDPVAAEQSVTTAWPDGDSDVGESPQPADHDPIADIIEEDAAQQPANPRRLHLTPTMRRLMSGDLSALDPENRPFSPNLLRMLMGGRAHRVKGAVRLHDIARPRPNRFEPRE